MVDNELLAAGAGRAVGRQGYGHDATVWGGEFLHVTANVRTSASRICERFRLPGGERAVREPRRAALGVLHEMGGARFDPDLPCIASFSAEAARVVGGMLATRLNAPLTSSAGRLFDALASLRPPATSTSFEGQAAMELEFARAPAATGSQAYPFSSATSADALTIVDWEPMVRGVLDDLRAGRHPRGHRAARSTRQWRT